MHLDLDHVIWKKWKYGKEEAVSVNMTNAMETTPFTLR